jgi:predicted amidohydrolase YtcJ
MLCSRLLTGRWFLRGSEQKLDLAAVSVYSFCVTLVILIGSAAGQPAADLILVNANIRTLDAKTPRADAMAVAGGRILAVGSDAAIRRHARPGSRIIDACGKLVLPGFNDSHVHFTAIGNRFSHLDMRGMAREEILAEITRYARFLPKGRWIIAGGIENAQLETAGPLPLDLLDKASPEHPLLIFVDQGRSVITNSAALKLAGINSATKEPSDGKIVRDRNGRPTGVFLGNAPALIRRHLPANHATNWAEIAETASNYAASLGVTSVQDVHSDELIETFKILDRSGRLKTRVYECFGIDAWPRASVSNSGFVRGGCVKGTAFGLEEELEELKSKVALADRAGLQVAIHAIGARSNRNALDAIEHAIRANGPRDRRFRMEHAARADVEDLTRFIRSNVIMSMQPHLFYSGPNYGEDYRRILDAGVTMALGSDASMTDFDPLFGIAAAVNSGSRSLTVEEAVRAYTLIAAFAEFQEAEKGSLVGGKMADFVILSEDIFTIDPHRIRAARVLMTAVGGKIVYDAYHK